MYSITKVLCSLQKREMWCKYRFSSCKKAVKPKLRQGHCDQGCSWLQGTFSSGTPPSNPHPISIPQSHHPWLPSGGVVTPPAWDLGSWDNGARSTKHNAVTKVSSLAGLFKPMGSTATWAGHGWLVSSWQQTVFGTQCIHGQCRAFVQSHADFPQVGFWLLRAGNGVEKSTQAERAPLAGDFSHLITWFSFPAVRKKMELHHAPCSLGKGPIVSNKATGDRHNACAPCSTSDIWSAKQVWVPLLGGSSIGNKGDQASPVSLPAPYKRKSSFRHTSPFFTLSKHLLRLGDWFGEQWFPTWN